MSSTQRKGVQFLVTCEGCPFEQTADGRRAATRIGGDHSQATGHDVVALELPRSAEPK